MRWKYESADFFEDVDIFCSVCKQKIEGQDFVYLPDFFDEPDDERADKIEAMFKIDPFTEFQICENCMEGHCGEVPGKNANTWVDQQYRKVFGGNIVDLNRKLH